MEDVVKSQRQDIEKSNEFLESVVDRIENFQKSMPPEFWELSTEKLNGPELYEKLTEASNEVLKLAQAAKGEILPVEEIPTGFSQDHK